MVIASAILIGHPSGGDGQSGRHQNGMNHHRTGRRPTTHSPPQATHIHVMWSHAGSFGCQATSSNHGAGCHDEFESLVVAWSSSDPHDFIYASVTDQHHCRIYSVKPGSNQDVGAWLKPGCGGLDQTIIWGPGSNQPVGAWLKPALWGP